MWFIIFVVFLLSLSDTHREASNRAKKKKKKIYMKFISIPVRYGYKKNILQTFSFKDI